MYKKMIVLVLVAMSFAMLQTAAWADFNPGEFARNFNSFVGNTGLTYQPSFIVRGSGPAYDVTDVSAYGYNLNIGAYSPNRAGYVDPNRVGSFPVDVGTYTTLDGSEGYYFADDLYFSSFALGGLTPPERFESVGQLSYDNGATRTSHGTAINLGIVYLYTKYATNVLGTLNATEVAELNTAMQLLLSGDITQDQWENNRFLSHLVTELGVGDVWRTPYNLNQTYPNWLDNNYAVYVMNLTQFAGPVEYSVGDVLYLVRRDGVGGSDVPEPATLLAWAAMGLGLFGTVRRRRERMV